MVRVVVCDRVGAEIECGSGKDGIREVTTQTGLPASKFLIILLVFGVHTRAETFIRTVGDTRQSFDCRIGKKSFQNTEIAEGMFRVGWLLLRVAIECKQLYEKI